MTRMLKAFLLPLAVLLLVAMSCDTVAAQSKLPVRLRIEPLSIRGRSGGPIPVQIKLEYNRNQIMEGDLVLNIYDTVISGESMEASIRYEGVVLQGSDYIFNTVFPPIEHSYNKLYQITGWFETETERISLTSDPDQVDPPAPHDLLSISPFERATLLCSCSGRRDYLNADANRAFLNRRLTLSNYNPATGSANNQSSGNRRNVITGIQDFAVNWDAYNLPEDPLHYCSFDVVLLAEGALTRLEVSQMHALTTWVKAGGSLCVLPDDNRLTGIHLEFLQTLFQRDDDPSLHLSLADDNTLLVIGDELFPIVNRHLGVGRVTLLPNMLDLQSRLTDLDIAAVVGHLWKIRSTSPIMQGKFWTGDRDARALLQRNGYTVQGQAGNFTVFRGYGRVNALEVNTLDEAVDSLGLNFTIQPRPNPLSAAAETSLLPEGIEMVPSWVIAVLLIAYVITIGPIDYFVLGFFRVRKFTWVVFPVVTGLFTALTIKIAHEYMATTGTGGTLSIVDVDEAGQPLRKTDLRMHFYASQTEVEVDASQTFTVPAQAITADFNQFSRAVTPRATGSNQGISYSGRFPQSYSTTQQIRQWEPQTVRTFSLAPEGLTIPKIDWNDPKLVTTPDGRLQLGKSIQQQGAGDSEVDAIVMHSGQQFRITSDGFLFASHQLAAGNEWLNQNQWQRYNESPDPDSIAALGIIQAAAASGRNDYFNIVSQVSPHGSASMEDLPVLDQTDKSQFLLIVAIRNKANNHTSVFRRLYHTSTPRLIAVQ